MTAAPPLLETIGVEKSFALSGGRRLRAVDGVSLEVGSHETLGLVGESGCGKSTLGRCLTRLYDVTGGSIRLEGNEITRLSERRLRPHRRRMQMIFQDPYASLNPRRRVADLVAEPLRVHGMASRAEVRERVSALLDLVGLLPEHLDRFPHEFSGGQRQRIGIARALALEPALIVADEPVSALDVSIQAQVINLFADLQERLGLTYVFIAHDLSVVRQIATRTAVMYLGALVEVGTTDAVFARPAHPYTEALLSAVPTVRGRRERIVLDGDPPSPLDPPSGCRFNPRCRFATDRCRVERPVLRAVEGDHRVACHYPLS